jgi:hypothetical protein
VALAAIFLLLGILAGCGGGSTPTSVTSNGTPAGTYTLTVTGTSSSVVQNIQTGMGGVALMMDSSWTVASKTHPCNTFNGGAPTKAGTKAAAKKDPSALRSLGMTANI